MRIGDMLLKAGLIDEMQLNAALAQQRQWGGKLGDLLVDQGFLDEMMLWLGLSKQLDVPLVSLPEMVITTDLVTLIPVEMCERLDIFPVARDDRTFTVATSDPSNVGGLDEVAFRVGKKLKTVLAPQREVTWAIRTYYRGERATCPPPKTRRKIQSDPPYAQPVQQQQVPPPVSRASTPLAQVRTDPNGQPPQTAEEQLRQANEMLVALVELCIQRGLFTREELWERLTSLKR